MKSLALLAVCAQFGLAGLGLANGSHGQQGEQSDNKEKHCAEIPISVCFCAPSDYYNCSFSFSPRVHSAYLGDNLITLDNPTLFDPDDRPLIGTISVNCASGWEINIRSGHPDNDWTLTQQGTDDAFRYGLIAESREGRTTKLVQSSGLLYAYNKQGNDLRAPIEVDLRLQLLGYTKGANQVVDPGKYTDVIIFELIPHEDEMDMSETDDTHHE